jgi:two-component system, cell cycle response regulator
MENASRVLLVEDDEDDFILTRDKLMEMPEHRWEVIWAPSYKQGLEELRKDDWGAILVDYRLGERDGIEFVRDAQARGCWAPIIILTGHGALEVDHAAMRAGAMDYLEKGQITGPLLERSLRYAVERSKALRSLRELAIHDELTGLYNRREFDRLLSEEIARSKRTHRPMSLVMLDLDKFKSVNDTHGHPVGDVVLQHASNVLRRQVRVIDRVARYGGDEFALILPDTIAKGAMLLANRLAQVIIEDPCRLPGEDPGVPGVPISFSLGVAEYPGDAGTQDELIARADQALYASKALGRGRASWFKDIPIQLEKTP